MNRVRAAVVGGSGYIGGELVRLLLQHPAVELTQVTSESQQGKFLHHVHPNLRQQTRLKFVSIAQLEACDVLFWRCRTAWRRSASRIFRVSASASSISAVISASGTRSSTKPGMGMITPARRCSAFVYGVPELHREAIASARLVTGAGCLATATILGLYPLARAGLLSPDRPWSSRPRWAPRHRGIRRVWPRTIQSARARYVPLSRPATGIPPKCCKNSVERCH